MKSIDLSVSVLDLFVLLLLFVFLFCRGLFLVVMMPKCAVPISWIHD
jgi:hypothetical protein